MNIRLQNIKVIDIHSQYHGLLVDIEVKDGLISKISESNLSNSEKGISFENSYISPGWFDLNAHFNDPGYEQKENINSGVDCALKGGFTDVQIGPETEPIMQSKGQIDYIRNKAGKDIDLYVNCALTKNLDGNQLTEVFDLFHSGSVAFSNGDKPITNAELLVNAFKYTNSLDATIFQNATNEHLGFEGQMHEGLVSTRLGIKGIPSVAEEICIKRDLDILKYAGQGNLHFTKISTKEGVELIRQAKSKGLNVSADVSIHHLIFTDESIGTFDTVYKVLPPYRGEEDRLALIEGVKDGTIDAICSNHRPQDEENKKLEFEFAQPGSISMQTFLHALLKLKNEVSLSTLIDRITNGPRQILKQDKVSIEVGQVAKLTIFNPDLPWELNEMTNASKSRNSPFWGESIKGKVIAVVNKDYYNKFN